MGKTNHLTAAELTTRRARSYNSAYRAQLAVDGLLDRCEGWDFQAHATYPRNLDQRFCPVIVFMGEDRVQMAINVAQSGFVTFA